MTIPEQIKEYVSDKIGQVLTRSGIIEGIKVRYGTNPGSIIPSDYCYNYVNGNMYKDIQEKKQKTYFFEYLIDEQKKEPKKLYKVLGADYPFKGNIWAKPTGWKKANIVGRWENGEQEITNEEYLNFMQSPVKKQKTKTKQAEKPKNEKSTKLKQQLTPNIKHETMYKAFGFIQPVLPIFIGKTLQTIDKNGWWQNLVIKKLLLNSTSTKDLPKNGSYDECIDSLDTSLSLKIIIGNWHDIFKQKIKDIKLSWVHELVEVRNDVSHWNNNKGRGYKFESIKHTLNVMKLFMDSIDKNASSQIFDIIREFEDKYED